MKGAESIAVPRGTRQFVSRAFKLARDSEHAARAARLRYMLDDGRGLSRRAAGRRFVYEDAKGRRIRDPRVLARIASLAIPPAWTGVWISPSAHSHIQATGRDANGRKQYRYHPRWRALRDETKYGRMIAFAQALPKIRARTDADLSLPGLPKTKVLAAVVQLLEKTMIRVGNEEYARANRHFGLTTMHDGHADVDGHTVRFQFVGKSGKLREVELKDRRLAAIVKRCQEVPGHVLFQYVDQGGKRQKITSADVNSYLREVSGADFTAKDYRTWAGTVLAARALREFDAFSSDTEAKRNVVRAVESVAMRLGNTKAVCRKCYIHPAILESYMDGSLVKSLAQRAEEELAASDGELSPEEQAVMTLIQQRLLKTQAA